MNAVTLKTTSIGIETDTWVKIASIDDFPFDGDAFMTVGSEQIAVYNFAPRGEGEVVSLFRICAPTCAA